MKHEKEYVTLINLVFELIESQSDRNIPAGQEWLNDAQVLSIKLFRHLASMQNLAKNTTLLMRNNVVATCVDHASVKVVARAALETYLVFFYIYGTDDRSMSFLRHMTWRLGGLIDRQKYTTVGEEAEKVVAQESNAIARLITRIEQTEQFFDYSKGQREQLLAGKWRVGKSWRDLANDAGFHEEYFSTIYNYLCGYSHSSYASALQVGQARELDDQMMLARTTISIGLVIMAHFAFTYPTIFHDAGIVLENNAESTALAQTWRFGREDMAEIYET